VQFSIHLMVGVILGLILFAIFRTRWVFFACALGSILPDVIDKPVGLFLLADSVGYGRIYFHSLTVCIIILAAGLLLLFRYRSGIILALGIGVLSHQVLDAMWLEYGNWLWPFYGPFTGSSSTHRIIATILAMLTNPTELLLLLLAFMIGLVLMVIPQPGRE
jgi:membrane-bound metal-dependent hydrolase YbcI (DUF457 family)